MHSVAIVVFIFNLHDKVDNVLAKMVLYVLVGLFRDEDLVESEVNLTEEVGRVKYYRALSMEIASSLTHESEMRPGAQIWV